MALPVPRMAQQDPAEDDLTARIRQQFAAQQQIQQAPEVSAPEVQAQAPAPAPAPASQWSVVDPNVPPPQATEAAPAPQMSLVDRLKSLQTGAAPPASGVDPGIEAAYQAQLSKDTAEEMKNRGFLRGVASDIAGGAVQGAETGLRALRTVLPELSPEQQAAEASRPKSLMDTVASTLGISHAGVSKGIESLKTLQAETPFLQEDTSGNVVSKAIHGGLRSFSQSLVAGVPGAVAGMAVGGPVGAVAGFALNAGTMFGLGQYDDVMERGVEHHMKQGLSREDAIAKVQPEAIWQGIVEGGFEFASDMLMGKFTGIDQLLKGPAKQGIKMALKDLTNISFKDYAKKQALISASEVGTEMIQGGLEADSDTRLGIGNQSFWDGAADSLGPAFVASLLFGGLGHANVKLGQRQAMRALADETAAPERRMAAVAEVQKAIEKVDPMLAKTWETYAGIAVKKGESINTDEDLREKLKNRIDTLAKVSDPSVEQRAAMRMWQEELNKQNDVLALPEPAGQEQGFSVASQYPQKQETAPGTVHERRSVEEAQALGDPAARLALPGGDEFDNTPGEGPAQKLERLTRRVNNLSARAEEITAKIEGIDDPVKRERLYQKLAPLQEQITVNEQARQMAQDIIDLAGSSEDAARAMSRQNPQAWSVAVARQFDERARSGEFGEATKGATPLAEQLAAEQRKMGSEPSGGPAVQPGGPAVQPVGPAVQPRGPAVEGQQGVTNEGQGQGGLEGVVGVGQEPGGALQVGEAGGPSAQAGGILQGQESQAVAKTPTQIAAELMQPAETLPQTTAALLQTTAALPQTTAALPQTTERCRKLRQHPLQNPCRHLRSEHCRVPSLPRSNRHLRLLALRVWLDLNPCSRPRA